VRRAHFLRAKQSRLNSVTSAFQVAADFAEAVAQVAADIFKEHEIRIGFLDDAIDLGPDMARVFRAELLAGARERLAGIRGNDAMNAAAPGAPVKGCGIRPHRRFSQGRPRIFSTSDPAQCASLST
jgi:hypothetical protein